MADTTSTNEPTNFDLLLDIPLEVTVEIGRTRLALRELLQLGPGAVVELGRPTGEPFDVLVNGKPIARGEAVLVNERFGVRLTEVISPAERLAGVR
jgi:flagellar motor switch protein FliN/FliY